MHPSPIADTSGPFIPNFLFIVLILNEGQLHHQKAAGQNVLVP